MDAKDIVGLMQAKLIEMAKSNDPHGSRCLCGQLRSYLNTYDQLMRLAMTKPKAKADDE